MEAGLSSTSSDAELLALDACFAGADATLCDLGRRTDAALRSVRASAEAAREQLCDLRAALHAAVDARFDALDRDVSRASDTAVATLESDLVAIDAALQT